MPAGDLQELAGNAHGQWQAIDGPKGFRQILFPAKTPETQRNSTFHIPNYRSGFELAEHQGGIGTAEPEGIGHGVIDLFFPGHIGDIIEITLIALIFQVNGGR